MTPCKVIKLKDGDVTLLTSLFMFYLLSFSWQFIVHVSFYFLQSSVHLIHIYRIWFHTLLLYLIVSFTFQPIQYFKINDLQVSLDKVLILDIQYLKLYSGVFTTPCLFISNKKYNKVLKMFNS